MVLLDILKGSAKHGQAATQRASFGLLGNLDVVQLASTKRFARVRWIVRFGLDASAYAHVNKAYALTNNCEADLGKNAPKTKQSSQWKGFPVPQEQYTVQLGFCAPIFKLLIRQRYQQGLDLRLTHILTSSVESHCP